jgi:hypothetical protein
MRQKGDKMRRKRVSRSGADWKRIFDEWSVSGESQQAFCEKREIGLSNFRRRRRLLSDEASDDAGGDQSGVLSGSAFVPVGGVRLRNDAPAIVLKWPGGVELRFAEMPDTAWIREVIRS